MDNTEQINWGDFINYRGTTVIPYWVNKIDDQAFCGCRDLKDVEIEDGVESIGADAFNECTKLTSIHIPASVRSIGIGAFAACNRLERITVDEDNPTFKAEGGCCLTKDGKTVVFGCREAVIPEGVVTIGDYAFHGIGGSSVVLPSSIRKIGNGAFAYNTTCTEIQLPASLESIGEMAFYNWDELKSIEIPASVRSIGQNAFQNCFNLETIMIHEGIKVISSETFSDCRSVKKIRIPSSVEAIESCAFAECRNLGAILIPDTVKSIGNNAFRRCAIRDIYLTAPVDKYDGGSLTDIKTGLVRDFHILAELHVLAGRADLNCYHAVLHVPEGTEEGYREHPFFKDFKDIVPRKRK